MFPFFIAGRNATDSIKNINLPNVHYVGEVDDAHEFMCSKGIMIVPILSGSGMRIKIVEGMALGRTIVTTEIGTEGIMTTHNKNIMIANQAEAFIASLDQLLSDSKVYKEIGNQAREFAQKHFDNQKICRKNYSISILKNL